MKRSITFLGLFLLITIIFITVGYSAFSAELHITNTVATIRAYKEVRINGVTTNSGYVSNLEYTHMSVMNTVSIPAGESVTYNVTVTNLGNESSSPVAVSNITFTNGSNQNVGNLEANIDDTRYEKICDNNNCTGPVSKIVILTITNTGSSTINTNLNVNLTFKKVYTITYNNAYQGEVLEGYTYTYTFDSNPPTTITVDSGTSSTPSINNSVLTIANVQSDLVLTGTAGMTGNGTWDSPYQDNTTQTYDYTNLNTDETVQYNNITGAPKVTTDSSGNVINFAFTDYGTDGITFGGTDPNYVTFDTGALGYRTGKYRIHITFKANLYNNGDKMFLTALQANDVSGTTKYSGYSINAANNTNSYLRLSPYIDKTYNGTLLNANANYNLNTQADASSHTENQYDVYIIYDSSNRSRLIARNNNGTAVTVSSSYVAATNKINNARITIGGNGINNTNDATMKLLFFEVTECNGTFDSSYNCITS